MACVVCEEVITQPLCGSCLAQQVATWLLERGEPGSLPGLAEATAEVLVREGVTSCIKCRAPMGLCSHCYLLHIGAWLAERHPTLVEEFTSLFGFHPRAVAPPARRPVAEGFA